MSQFGILELEFAHSNQTFVSEFMQSANFTNETIDIQVLPSHDRVQLKNGFDLKLLEITNWEVQELLPEES